MSNKPYEVTAETIYPCQVAFIRREEFFRFIAKHPEASQCVLKQMSAQYQDAYEQLRTVGLSATAQEKLARLLLNWKGNAQHNRDGARLRLPLTHEEIAEFIGTTRETVTRTFSEFKLRHLVSIQGTTVTIPNWTALESLAHV